jgi:hypothetical protein
MREVWLNDMGAAIVDILKDEMDMNGIDMFLEEEKADIWIEKARE